MRKKAAPKKPTTKTAAKVDLGTLELLSLVKLMLITAFGTFVLLMISDIKDDVREVKLTVNEIESNSFYVRSSAYRLKDIDTQTFRTQLILERVFPKKAAKK